MKAWANWKRQTGFHYLKFIIFLGLLPITSSPFKLQEFQKKIQNMLDFSFRIYYIASVKLF